MTELLAGTGEFLKVATDGMCATHPRTEHAVFAHPLPFNVIPQIDSPQENGYTREEMKVS